MRRIVIPTLAGLVFIPMMMFVLYYIFNAPVAIKANEVFEWSSSYKLTIYQDAYVSLESSDTNLKLFDSDSGEELSLPEYEVTPLNMYSYSNVLVKEGQSIQYQSGEDTALIRAFIYPVGKQKDILVLAKPTQQDKQNSIRAYIAMGGMGIIMLFLFSLFAFRMDRS